MVGIMIIVRVDGTIQNSTEIRARKNFVQQVNVLLRDYKDGFELSENGEILASIEDGLDDLVKEQLVEYDPKNVDNRIESANIKIQTLSFFSRRKT